MRLSEEERDRYWDLMEAWEQVTGADMERPQHQLLGHSVNIQGDMQLEAQLVSNGIYCGDARGYRSQRARELAAGADDWLLLFQLDSDERANMLWGDGGMLFYWIRTQDLAHQQFDHVWMTMQCH